MEISIFTICQYAEFYVDSAIEINEKYLELNPDDEYSKMRLLEREKEKAEIRNYFKEAWRQEYGKEWGA